MRRRGREKRGVRRSQEESLTEEETAGEEGWKAQRESYPEKAEAWLPLIRSHLEPSLEVSPRRLGWGLSVSPAF